MLKKLICYLFHKKYWMHFNSRKWLLNYWKPYRVICSKCGREFKLIRWRLTYDEQVTLRAMRNIIKDPDRIFKPNIMIEEELADFKSEERRR